MPFDWDGDGDIDDYDIELGVALLGYDEDEDEDENNNPTTGNKHNPGCLHTTLVIISAITGAIGFLIGWL